MRATFGFRQLLGLQHLWRLALGLVVLALSGCAMFTASDIKSSPNDSRAYRHLVLDNQLQVLLISDPTTEKAAAAMDVSVGSRHDPRDHQGLAHFLEHMLFLGTQKYPEAGEYQSFISQHGGSHNAYTAYENTNYFFDIQPDFLEPALDRFSQQFVAPLFTAEYVQREKNAVHSEFSSGLRDDGRRYYSALKEAVNPRHPFASFAVGNLETLADGERSIRDTMLDFYERHYSANQMRLVIYGKEDLDTLEQWARQKFSAIPNRNVASEPVKEPLIEPGQLPALLTVEPIMEKRTLTLLFPMPTIKPHYRAKPEYYLSNLIGHEGEGSLLSWLKKQGWADSLASGMALDNQEESALSITISLTEEGLKQYPQVIRSTFEYIDLIRRTGIDRWRFEEQAKLLEIDFRFQEKATPIHYTSYLASRMRHHAAEEVLVAPYLMDRYDPELYRRLLGYLTPDNVLISLMAKGVTTDRESVWYKAPYGYRQLTSEERQAITPAATAQAAMHMPEPNPFIPEDLAMRKQPDMPEPARLPTKENLLAWYMQDTSFGTPRGNFYLSVRSPAANTSPRHAALTELFVALADDQLNEYIYPAALAGLDYRIYKHLRGFTIRLEGYSDKQQQFLSDILDRLTRLEPTPERFAIAYDNLRRQLENAQQYRPYERTLSEVRKLLLDPYWTEQELLAALRDIRYEDLVAFIPKLFAEMTTVTLAHGNFSQEQAQEMNRLVAEKLADKAKFAPVERSQVVSLQPGSNWYRGLVLEHRDTGFTWLFQAQDREYRTRARYSLLAQLLSAPYYHELRTERQLGYVVFATPLTLLEVPALAFVVQSPAATPEQLKDATWSFLTQAADQLKSLPDEAYEQHRLSLMANLLQRPTTLTEKSERFWINIDEKNYDFDTLERIAAEVATLEKAELIRFLEEEILAKPTSLLAFSQYKDAAKEIVPANFRKVESKSQLIQVNGLFPNR